MNTVLSHPFPLSQQRKTQTPHWLSEGAVQSKAPSTVQNCAELEEQRFLDACHLNLIKWKKAQLIFAPQGVMHWVFFFVVFVCVFFWAGACLWLFFGQAKIIPKETPAKSIKYHL